jgi:hypothetical protein
MCVVVEKVHFFARPEWIRIQQTRAASRFRIRRARERRANENVRTNATEAFRRARERERDVMNEGRV